MQAEKSLCSIDVPAEQLGRKEGDNYINQSKSNTKIVTELLKKVKKRRKLVRSYSYFTWFCIFFISYLGNLYIKTVCISLFQASKSSDEYSLIAKVFSIFLFAGTK